MITSHGSSETDERNPTVAEPRTVSVQVSRRFSVPPERVFDAWLDPDLAGRFLFSTPSGEMVTTEIDARIGGRYSIIERRDGEDIEHCGEYLEIDRPRRLVFTFGVPRYSDATTIVTVDITPTDDGCELTLIDESAPVEWAERNRDGWTDILEGLAGVVGG